MCIHPPLPPLSPAPAPQPPHPLRAQALRTNLSSLDTRTLARLHSSYSQLSAEGRKAGVRLTSPIPGACGAPAADRGGGGGGGGGALPRA
jgi:hypothetical protein